MSLELFEGVEFQQKRLVDTSGSGHSNSTFTTGLASGNLVAKGNIISITTDGILRRSSDSDSSTNSPVTPTSSSTLPLSEARGLRWRNVVNGLLPAGRDFDSFDSKRHMSTEERLPPTGGEGKGTH